MTWPVFGQVTLTLPFGGIHKRGLRGSARKRCRHEAARNVGAVLNLPRRHRLGPSGVKLQVSNPAKQQPSKLDSGAEVKILEWHGNGTVRRSGFTAGASRGSRLLPYAMRDFYKPASIEMGLKGAEGKVRT